MGKDDVIVFAQGVQLMRVSAGGGTPSAIGPLNEQRRETDQSWPSFMPDRRRIVYFEHRNPSPSAVSLKGIDNRGLMTLSLPDGFRTERSGDLWVYGRAGALVARRSDRKTDDVVGEELPVAEGVAMVPGAGGVAIGSALFSAASDTTLAYFNEGTASHFVIVDRSGRTERTLKRTAVSSDYASPAVSPDGTRVAFTSFNDVWVEDLTNGNRVRISDDGASQDPVWSPDGQRIVYASHPKQVDHFIERDLGSGRMREWPLIVGQSGFARPLAWLPDGHRILYASRTQATALDLSIADEADPRHSHPVVNGRFNERAGAVSPDGHWLLYASDETGQQEIWARPFDGSSQSLKLTSEGGAYVRWGRNGKEVFWITLQGVLMAAPIRSLDPLNIGPADPLFQTHIANAGRGPYDVFPDGQRFVIQQASDQPLDNMTIVVNWASALRR